MTFNFTWCPTFQESCLSECSVSGSGEVSMRDCINIEENRIVIESFHFKKLNKWNLTP